jgi:hypothetical protein
VTREPLAPVAISSSNRFASAEPIRSNSQTARSPRRTSTAGSRAAASCGGERPRNGSPAYFFVMNAIIALVNSSSALAASRMMIV